MGTLVFILSILAAVLLILVVLIQNPKGGGIDSTFGAANQLGSVQKTNDAVEKATWYLAGIIVVLAISSTVLITKKVEGPTTEEISNRLDPNFNATQNTAPITTFEETPNNGAPTK